MPTMHKVLQFRKRCSEKNEPKTESAKVINFPSKDHHLIEFCARLLNSAINGDLRGIIYLPNISNVISPHFYCVGTFMHDQKVAKRAIDRALLPNFD